jgi:Endoglucanase
MKYGFNFLWMFSKNKWQPLPAEPDLHELEFVAQEGFNFVRIPTDYHFWTRDFDYTHPDEAVLGYIDRYIEACNSFGLHACLNIHRAPGYCINSPELERHNLWRDAEAQEGFSFLWKLFTDRYRGISGDMLSFDLVNEPCDRPPTHPCTRADHEAVIRKIIADIRTSDPARPIVIDGFDGGGTALPELADAGVIHSGRGYYPFQVTHYKAEWAQGADKWDMPEYPGQVARGEYADKESIRRYYAPWREVEAKGVEVHIGEFGCYNKLPNDLALRWFSDLIEVFAENRWGYSLWNFKGSFGVVEHGRPGTVYENYKGFKVDRELLEILKNGRR